MNPCHTAQDIEWRTSQTWAKLEPKSVTALQCMRASLRAPNCENITGQKQNYLALRATALGTLQEGGLWTVGLVTVDCGEKID